MKHLKTYKLFESDGFDWFKELFLELSDEGFGVSASESNSVILDFSKRDHFTTGWIETKSGTIKTINVKVEKRRSGEPTESFTSRSYLESFNIDEVKETLRFAESYAKDELGLKLEYIYVVKIPNYTYYKSVDVLPNDSEVDSITFAFRKSQ